MDPSLPVAACVALTVQQRVCGWRAQWVVEGQYLCTNHMRQLIRKDPSVEVEVKDPYDAIYRDPAYVAEFLTELRRRSRSR